MSLTESEIERYSRHLLLDDVGIEGQEKIKNSKILVIGAGGLGSPVLLYLAAAGFGTITIADHDILDISNLQRQVLFNQNYLGKNKAIAAIDILYQLNNEISLNSVSEGLTTENALELFSEHDIIIDGTDNFSTRYLICDASIITSKPVVYGAIHKFEGQVSIFNYQNGPTYRCLFPTPPNEEKIQNCEEVGVLGILPGIIGTLMTNEVLKMTLGIGEPLNGTFFTLDAKNLENSKLKFQRNQANIDQLGLNSANFKSRDYQLLCEFDSAVQIEEINGESFHSLLDNSDFIIVDVREPWEKPDITAKNLIQIPLKTLDDLLLEEVDKTYITICQSGTRSHKAAMKLKARYPQHKIKNLKGGINSI